MRSLKPILALLAVILALLLAAPAAAQVGTPAEQAEAARVALLNAQLAIQSGETARATAELKAGQQAYAALAEQARSLAPADAASLAEQAAAIQLTGAPQFAAARTLLYATALRGATAATLAAAAQGDAATATRWLQLRVFRKATRLVRTSADATTALQGLRAGTLPADKAAAAVRADLLDGYLAQSRDALVALQAAAAKQSLVAAAEQAALAKGYAAIVLDAYAQQRGADAAQTLQTQLTALTAAAVNGDWPTITAGVTAAQDALRGFSAAPLSDEEVTRKGTQLLQFVNLLQLEYAKGIREGHVVAELEVTEAKTFHTQASGLLDELSGVFAQRDPAATAAVTERLGAIGGLLRTTGDPAEVTRLANEIAPQLTEKLGVSAQGGDLVAVQALLKQLRAAVAAGDYATAETIRLQSYAIFEVGAEPKLMTRSPQLGEELQAMFWQGTSGQPGLADLVSRRAPLAELDRALGLIETQISAADAALGGGGSALGAITGAVAILIREGLEAVLVLAAIVGYLRATKAPARATRQVLGGAGAAILASFAVWLLAQQVLTITPANRELMSGIIALIAAVVLVSVTNWLLHKVYVVDWVGFVKAQVQQAMGRSSVLGLALLGFMIVFREGFETVLFFQALLADSPPWAVAVGAAIGCAIIAVVAWAVLKLGVRLPLKPFFTVTSLLLLVMAVSFVGNGVRNLQEAGLIGVTRLEGIPLGLVPALLGLFPTYETVAAQLVLLTVVAGTFAVSRYRAAHKPVAAPAR